MKKLLILGFCTICLLIGFMIGKIHVLNNSKIYTYENKVYIEIDNNLYVHEID